MAGAFHGLGEPETVINVGVSGPGTVSRGAGPVWKLGQEYCAKPRLTCDIRA